MFFSRPHLKRYSNAGLFKTFVKIWQSSKEVILCSGVVPTFTVDISSFRHWHWQTRHRQGRMLPIGNIRAWGEKSIKKQVGAEIVAEASGILSRLCTKHLSLQMWIRMSRALPDATRRTSHLFSTIKLRVFSEDFGRMSAAWKYMFPSHLLPHNPVESHVDLKFARFRAKGLLAK